MENFSVNYSESLAHRVTQVMKRVYVKMFLALLVTAVVAFLCGNSETVLSFMVYNSWAYWGILIVEILLVLGISSSLTRFSSPIATALFYLFAIVNGISLSVIVAIYTPASIFKTFLITSAVFGAMSIYGYFTTSDLTKVGSFLRMALIGLIIAIVINIFWANSTLDWLISIAGVLIFVGLTAWDTQKIKQMASMLPNETAGRLATIGALSLYLDFINLFIYLLRFFGASRD
ncbi:MAG: Bax inhibitor-1/YccA family protein [Muribaculaceae bacterium]|nr:Bax inhibitor-1/YccA family protein [Muribaculaceae bacterium]